MVSRQHLWVRVVSYHYPLQYPQRIISGTSVHVDRDLATLYQYYGYLEYSFLGLNGDDNAW